LTKLNKLIKLELSGNNFDYDEAEQIKKAFPECEIVME
jgi:hypothetical protein